MNIWIKEIEKQNENGVQETCVMHRELWWQFRGRGVPSRAWEGRGPLPLNWVPPSMYEN